MLLKELVAELRNLANEHQEIEGFYTGLASEQNDSMIQYPALRVNFPYNALTSQDDDVISITFNLNLLVQSVDEITGALSYEVETNYMNQQDTLNEKDQVLVDETELREKAIRIMATYIQGLRLLEDEYPYFIVQDGWRIVGIDRHANDFVTGCSVELTISVANDYKCLSIDNPDYSVWKENINFDSPILYKNIDCPDCPTCPELSDYDFADPLVQAELTPQQDSDLTDYLIPLADFSDPAIQALLTPTQEGDLESLLCTPCPTSPQYSMSFDGSNEYIVLYDRPQYNFTNLQPFTITSWIKSNNYASVSNQGIMTKRSGALGGTGWSFFINGGNLYALLQIGVYYIQMRTNGVILTNNTWYHVALTVSGSGVASGVKIYVNGVQSATVTLQNNLNGSMVNTATVIIGAENASPMFFNGKIGYSRLFNIELSGAQVIIDYNGGTMLETSANQADQVLGWKAGQDALVALSDWFFPNELDITQQAPYSVNMEAVDRTTDVPV